MKDILDDSGMFLEVLEDESIDESTVQIDILLEGHVKSLYKHDSRHFYYNWMLNNLG